MKKASVFVMSMFVLMALALSACGPTANLSQVGAGLGQAKTAQLPAQTNPVSPQPGLLAAYESTLESVYSQVSPSVVNIRVVKRTAAPLVSDSNVPGFPFQIPGFPDFPGNPGDQTPSDPGYSQGLGSGFVWDTQGHIVTNNHVVDGAEKIEVTFADGTVVPAKLVGADPYADLAVVQVDVPASKLTVVALADSTQVKVGELAIAIGNPFGLQGTMTVGIISALGRSLPVDNGQTLGPTYTIPEVIQTDAPINPGNSGGVLVDDQGKVVGVTAAIESPVGANAGIGFVIPSVIVQKVLPGLIADGTYAHPWLGISGTSLNPDLANAMSLPADTRGALVSEVAAGGPADKAGLHGSTQQIAIDGQTVNVGGDVITALDGEQVRSMDDLIALMFIRGSVGQKVTLSMLRDGKEQTVAVTLASRPAASTQQTSASQPAQKGVWLGIRGMALSPELVKALELPSGQQGILVQQVEIGSPAAEAGLRGGSKSLDINGQTIMVGGDIITQLDGLPVSDVLGLRALLGNYDSGQEATLMILRDGKEMELNVTLAEPEA